MIHISHRSKCRLTKLHQLRRTTELRRKGLAVGTPEIPKKNDWSTGNMMGI